VLISVSERKSLSTLSQKSATVVAEFGDCRRCLAVFGDSRTFLRQCGQDFTKTIIQHGRAWDNQDKYSSSAHYDGVGDRTEFSDIDGLSDITESPFGKPQRP